MLDRAMHRSRCVLGALVLLAAVTGVADWRLEPGSSTIGFTTVKADHVAENHRFDTFSGRVSEAGEVRLVVPLDSANTGIAIRDERIRDLLFDGRTIEAVVTSRVDPQAIPMPGATDTIDLAMSVSLIGLSIDLVSPVLVTRVGEDQVMVSSQGPVLLNVERLGWASGVEKLREIAGLPSISHAVPVSFVLTFKRDS